MPGRARVRTHEAECFPGAQCNLGFIGKPRQFRGIVSPGPAAGWGVSLASSFLHLSPHSGARGDRQGPREGGGSSQTALPCPDLGRSPRHPSLTQRARGTRQQCLPGSVIFPQTQTVSLDQSPGLKGNTRFLRAGPTGNTPIPVLPGLTRVDVGATFLRVLRKPLPVTTANHRLPPQEARGAVAGGPPDAGEGTRPSWGLSRWNVAKVVGSIRVRAHTESASD